MPASQILSGQENGAWANQPTVWGVGGPNTAEITKGGFTKAKLTEFGDVGTGAEENAIRSVKKKRGKSL